MFKIKPLVYMKIRRFLFKTLKSNHSKSAIGC